MRILVRNVRTQFYLTPDAGWTRDRNGARDFGSSLTALKFVREERIENMEVVLTFGEPDLDLTIKAEA